MDNKNTIPDNLRSDVVRNLIENKNVLAQKGALYVGTGNSQEFDGTSCAETTSVTPPTENYSVLVSDSTSADGGLKWEKMTDAISNARAGGQSFLVDRALSADNVSGTINGVAIGDILENDGKIAKESTLAQTIKDGAITVSAFKYPQSLVSHSILIKDNKSDTRVSIACVNNSSSYGNNFLKFCQEYHEITYPSMGVYDASFLTVSGYTGWTLKHFLEEGQDYSVSQSNPVFCIDRINKGTPASGFQYQIVFDSLYYESRIEGNANGVLSLYIRNGDDGTKAYKNINPVSGELVFTMQDLAYSVTGIVNI